MRVVKESVVLFIVLFVFTGCNAKDANNTEPIKQGIEKVERESNTNNEDETEILENGFKMGEYTFFLMNMQKENDETKEFMLTILENNIIPHFEKNESRIIPLEKISLIPYSFTYDKPTEKVEVNYFLVNNSQQIVKSVLIKGKATFKNVDFNETVTIDFDEKTFTDLFPKGVTTFKMKYPAPYDKYFDLLKENQITDLSFEIEELEINGEKVENVNS